MRKKLVAGNWKMNGSCQSVLALANHIKKGANDLTGVELAVFPSFLHIIPVRDALGKSAIAVGAQNLYLGVSGAFTGEVSGAMLADAGCHYVLVGHSERRIVFQENLQLVAEKFKAAQSAKLIPILCVGETMQERERGETESVIQQQLASVLEAVSINAFRQAVIAYEPVWAIGTGLTSSPELAQSVHAFIRAQLALQSGEIAASTRILYGGSVKADNANVLFSMPDIDGGLVGGASLEADGFLAICRAAMR